MHLTNTFLVAGSALGAILIWRRIRKLEERLHRRTFKPDYIILLRHGESEANIDPSKYGPVNAADAHQEGYGDPNVRLSAQGILQASEAGDRLARKIGKRTVLMYVSPYQRTRQTADAVESRLRAAGVRVSWRWEDPRLREREFCGSFQREEPHRDEEWQYSRFFWRPASGESCADVYDRITTFLETLWRDFASLPALEGGAVVVVSHGLTNRIFAMRWLHWTPEAFALTSNPGNGAAIVLVRDPNGRYRLDPESLAVLRLDRDPTTSRPTAQARGARDSLNAARPS